MDAVTMRYETNAQWVIQKVVHVCDRHLRDIPKRLWAECMLAASRLGVHQARRVCGSSQFVAGLQPLVYASPPFPITLLVLRKFADTTDATVTPALQTWQLLSWFCIRCRCSHTRSASPCPIPIYEPSVMPVFPIFQLDTWILPCPGLRKVTYATPL